MQLPVMAGLLAGIVAAAAGAGDVGIAAIASTQAAAMQEQRRFSRQNEQEADRIGLVNLEKAGFDPRAMPSMFERLMRQYRYDRRPPEFLLTHPVSESRIADTRNRAEQFTGKGITDSVRYQLMRARVQLIYEETPGVAAKRFRNMLDDNPQLEAARYGLAIAQIKTGQLKEARESLQPLLTMAPNDVNYNLAQIELDMTDNRLDDAEQRIKRLLSLFPNNYPINQANIDLLMKQRRIQDAERALDSMLKSRSKDPDIWYQVAEVRGLAGNTVGLHQARGEFFALVGDYNQALEQLDFAKRRASNNFQLASRIDARQRELMEEKRLIEQMLR
jgi:predicted Zn-dependent protease